MSTSKPRAYDYVRKAWRHAGLAWPSGSRRLKRTLRHLARQAAMEAIGDSLWFAEEKADEIARRLVP